MTKRRFRQISFGLGLVLFAYLIKQLGWGHVLDDFRDLGWFFLLVLALSGAKYVVHALAWATAFFPDERQSWRRLFGSRLAGEALNYLSVAGPLLGEPTKASMLRGVRFTPGLASTLLETTVNGMAGIVVIVAGLAWLVFGHAAGSAVRYASYGGILILSGVVIGFAYILKRQLPFLTGPWKRVQRFRRRSSPEIGENLRLIEERMHRMSTERPCALGLIFLLSFIAQGFALAEVYAILIPLGVKASISGVLVVEAFTKLAKAVFFFVPARVGADEGSSAGIFALLGLGPVTGVTLALARRLRALFWSGIGLIFLMMNAVKEDAPRPEGNLRPAIPNDGKLTPASTTLS